MTDSAQLEQNLCSDCPRLGYPTDTTRCASCPRASNQTNLRPSQPMFVTEKIIRDQQAEIARLKQQSDYWFGEYCGLSQDDGKLKREIERLSAVETSGCTRSHPHELMSPECELRTEITRLTNQLARWESPDNWGAFVELLGLPPDHVNKPLGVAASIVLLNSKLDRYMKALQTANGYLIMNNMGPVKLVSEHADESAFTREEWDRVDQQTVRLQNALRNLISATEDTLRSHPETECCTVTHQRCVEARDALGMQPEKSKPASRYLRPWVGTARMFAQDHNLAVTDQWCQGWNACLDALDERGCEVERPAENGEADTNGEQ